MVHNDASPVSTRRAVQGMLPGLTLARVIAMCMILVAHSLMSYTWFRDRTLIWPVLEAQGWLPLDAITLPLRGIALPFFFLLAGISAGLAASTMSAQRYLHGRWRFLGLPLVVGMLTVFPLTLAVYLYAMRVTGHANMSPEQLELVEHLGDRPHLWGPIHLWFLEFLLLISCGYASVLWASRRFARVGRAVDALRDCATRTLNSRWRTLVFAAPLLAIFLVDLRPWEVLFHAFVPQPATLVYYATFFALGVCIARLPQPRETLGRSCWLELAMAVACYPPLAALCWHHFQQPLAGPLRSLLMIVIAISTAASIFAMLGLCVRYARRVDPVTQYLAHTSFWIYLAHVPLVMLLQAELWRYALPTPLKFFLVVGGSLSLSLAMYELLVRPGWLGKMLQGKPSASAERPQIRLARRVASVGIAAALVAVLGYGGWLASQHNFHSVANQRVYRSARLPAARLEQLIEKCKLRHVIVVCDAHPASGWFAEQQRICDKHAVTLHVVALPSRESPSPAALAALVSALQHADGPLLIEGKTGINREGVAAAVAQLLHGASPAEARRQFSWRYGYVHAYAAKGPHAFLDQYQAWLAATTRSHSPEQFAAWVASTTPTTSGALADANPKDASSRR